MHRKAGVGSPNDVSADLDWAAWNLGAAAMGRRLIEKLVTGEAGFKEIEDTFQQPWEVVEIAGMSLLFGDAMTALDLAADAVVVASGEPRAASGQSFAVSSLKRVPNLARPPPQPIADWIAALIKSPSLGTLEASRHALTLRRVRRQIAMSLGTRNSRSVISITTDAGTDLRSIDGLSQELLDFSTEQFCDLCEALTAGYPTPQTGPPKV